jgi:gliding motility-associated-like protein
MKNSLCTLFLAVGTLLSFHTNAQIRVYGGDSLKGFDERAVINKAVIKGVSGQMLKEELIVAKKEYIYATYYKPGVDLAAAAAAAAPTLPQPMIVQPSCTNMDFETGTFFGWDLSSGTVSNSQTMAGCCPTVGAPASAIINTSTMLTDPVIPGLNLASPLGGTYIARINNSATGAVVNRIQQTFSVTTTNSAFQLAFAAVLNSTGNHCCDEQPNINITLLDSANNVLTCPFLSFSAPSACCPNSDPAWVAFGQGHYRNWTLRTIDLQRYIGTAITVQITVSDCTQSGHYGYAYFDMKCVPLEITTNGTPYNVATQDSAFISPCGATSAIIGVPDGLGPYLWEGPPTSTVTGVTTSTINTNVAGTYTVTMSPPGACPLPGNPTGVIVKKAILRFTPKPVATASAAQPTCSNATGTGQINVTGGTGPYTFSWTPVASNSSVANGLTPGTSYTIIVTDSMGCKDTTDLTINAFPDAPTFTITPLNGVLTCATPSITLSAITGTNTTGVWTGTTTPTIDVTTPGTYTVILTNTVSVGQCSTSVNVTVTGNTVQPTATFTVSCNTTTITLNAASQPGVALGWLAPTLPNPSPVPNPGTSTAIGVFTLTATNLSTGCKQTYTVSTDIPEITVVTNPTTNSITCNTPTVLATTTSTNGGVSITWLDGVGTSTVNPYGITAPGTYTTIVASPGGCTSQSVITVTENKAVDVNVSSLTTTISCATGTLDLMANSSSAGSYTYSWTPATPAPFVGNVYNVSDAGSYTVMATNAVNGCTAQAVYAVTHESITAAFVPSPSTGLMPLPVTFSNTSSPNSVDYLWTLGNSSTTYTTVNAATVYQMQGTYTVTLIARNGVCYDTATTTIVVDMVSFITIPNVFTPNGDGINDIFSLNPINIGDISMTIYDRWGLKMYDTTTTGSLTWDGKTKGGTPVADGTYFYIINAKGLDGKDFNFQGSVNVFR